METITMTPAEWAAIPGNPRQRNTEERLKHASNYLSTPLPVHAVVHMAMLPDGSRFKLDGHTRDLFWRTHPGLAPEVVYANTYPIETIADVLMLYDTFDSSLATETTPDKIYGTFREKEFHAASDFVRRSHGLAAAMRLAYMVENRGRKLVRAADVHQLTEWYLPEIKTLDTLYLGREFFPAPVVTAALLTLRRHSRFTAFRHRGDGYVETLSNPDVSTRNEPDMEPLENVSNPNVSTRNERYTARKKGLLPAWEPARFTRVVEFWDHYNRDAGARTETAVNPVEALHRVLNEHRVQKQKKETVGFLASKGVSCVERYIAPGGEAPCYRILKAGKVAVRGTNLATYFPAPKAKVKATENVTDDYAADMDTEDMPLAAMPQE